MTKKIVVFGSVVQDLISYTDSFPRPGESVRGNAFLTGGGGKGANQAVAAARLGADVNLLGKVGDDIFGDSNISDLRKAGVNVDNIEKSATSPTATATITVNKDGENTIVVTLGANLELGAEVAERMEKIISKAGIVMIQAEVPHEGNKKALELAKKYGVRTFFNPAPGDRYLDTSILSLVDIVCTNENEAEFITNTTASTVDDAKKAAERMLEMGPNCAIVTLGGQGAVVATKNHSSHVTSPKVQVADTTGAGDCFCGTFCAQLMAGKSEIDAASSAVAVASLSVQRKGTQKSYWTKEEIQEKCPDVQL